MQTFLAFEDFGKSAKVLDDKRLWKQCLEAKQILTIVRLIEEKEQSGKDNKISWENHPAIKMWKGYEETLKEYLAAMLEEWLKRRFPDLICEIYTSLYPLGAEDPIWLGRQKFHTSHKANLYFKDSKHYKQFKQAYDRTKKDDKGKPEYFWPGEK